MRNSAPKLSEGEPLYSTAPTVPSDSRDFWTHYARRIGTIAPAKRAGVPDFIFVSPGKTGTCWLARHLARHPQVFFSPEKEVRYFDSQWRVHDINGYLDRFVVGSGSVKGDATASFAWLPAPAVREVQKLNPNLKLLLLARDLPQRAWSHTRHCHRYKESTFRASSSSFASLSDRELLKNFLSDFILSASDYSGIIKRWLQFFPAAQFHVRYFEDAMQDPEGYLRGVFRFLGVPADIPIAWDNLAEPIHPGIPATMPVWAESALADIYASRQMEIETLFSQMFGLKSPWRRLEPPGEQRPVWVVDRPDGWRIYFFGSTFHAVPGELIPEDESALKTLLAAGSPKVVRGQFLGSLLAALNCPTNESFQEDTCLLGVLEDLLDCSIRDMCARSSVE